MVTETELFVSSDLTPLEFSLWSWMKSEDYKRKVDKQDELLARILDTAVRINKCEDQGGGILEHLVNCNKFVISV
jgi:hypothetical protein